MRTMRLASSVVSAVRGMKKDAEIGDGTMSGVVSRAVRLYGNKHGKCFECPYHKELVARLELARQKLAGLGDCGEESEFVGVRSKEIALANRLACQGKSARQVVEQALLEHVARPESCYECSYYEEMCQTAIVGRTFPRKNNG